MLQQEVKRLHAAEKTVVWTNGCFDILHPGHIATFKKCKEIGDILVVGMNGKDSSYWKTKPGRPINDEDFRAAMLEAIRFVDIVYVFNDETPAPIVEVIHPDIVLKGGDYLSPAVSEMIAEKNMQIVHDGMLELTEVYRQMILG
ncbi:MAG: adenylyltransferase/cytidyltransferase family protein [Candidatus Peribacteria bacterium]|nr:MAG: adenylyltransferase/cytidyltransferase family protein [Candidatus Peribacteria bacterium]